MNRKKMQDYQVDNMYMLGLFFGLIAVITNMLFNNLWVKVASISILSIPIIICLTLRLLSYHKYIIRRQRGNEF